MCGGGGGSNRNNHTTTLVDLYRIKFTTDINLTIRMPMQFSFKVKGTNSHNTIQSVIHVYYTPYVSLRGQRLVLRETETMTEVGADPC